MFVASEAEIASDTIHRHYCHANQHQYVAPSIWKGCALNFPFWLSLSCHCCRHHFPMPKPTTTAVILILIADSNNKGSGIGSGFQCKTFVNVIWICPELNEKAKPISWPPSTAPGPLTSKSCPSRGVGSWGLRHLGHTLWTLGPFSAVTMENPWSSTKLMRSFRLGAAADQEDWRVGVMGHSLFELPNGSFVDTEGADKNS